MHWLVSTASAGLALLAVVYYFVSWQLLMSSQDAQEPPAIETAVPFLSPIFGFLKWRKDYFSVLRDKYRLPITTIRMPFNRFYVINSPQLIASVQRQYRTLTFQEIEDKFSRRICEVSPHAVGVQERELELWRNGPSNVQSPAHVLFKALAPGPHLDDMNRKMVTSLVERVERGLKSENGVFWEGGLMEWIKEEITIATTDGVYGAGNPYRDAKVREAYWKYDSAISTLATGFLPSLFASSALRARSWLTDVWQTFYETNEHLRASTLVRQRFENYASKGYKPRDIYSFEVGNGTAILSNTIPTAFWVCYHLFSSPAALEACRSEVTSHVVTTRDESGRTVKTIDISKLKSDSPMLLSALKEAMRVRSIGTGARMASHDFLLDGRWLVKKGNLIIMPTVVQHSDPQIWGSDVAEYNYERFTPDLGKKRPRVNPISFRSFGGGSTLCPGRHFAMTEVIVLAAMLLLRFDVQPVGGEKEDAWPVPTMKHAAMTNILPQPDQDIPVRIQQKKEDQEVKWVWNLSASTAPVMLSAEDIERDAQGGHVDQK